MKFSLTILLVITTVVGLTGCQSNRPPRPLRAMAEAEAPHIEPPPSLSGRIISSGAAPAASVPTPEAFVAAATSPSLPAPVLITHGDRTQPYIALTFDACQSAERPAGYDEAIIQILTETHTPATLFLGGLWMQRHPNQTQALASNPLFELASHSWSHQDFSGLTVEEMSADIERTQVFMAKLTGRQPVVFRFPFDVGSPEALAVVNRHGLQAISGDVVSGDPDPGISAGAMVKAVTGQAQNGSIVIMHMNTWGWHTAEALPEIVEQLREQGYRLVTVSELLELAKEKDPKGTEP